MPLGISLIFLFFNFNKPTKKKIFISILFLWTFSIGLVSNLLLKLVEFPWVRIEEELAPIADAIVVLGNNGRPIAPGMGTVYEWNDPDRVFAGIKLFKQGKAPRLFFTGGTTPYTHVKTEGTLYKAYAINLGIPSNSITTTGRVFNTAQEALAIRKEFNQKNFPNKILLVTSAFHMQRAQKIFERQGFLVHPFPVDFKTSKFLKWQNPYQWIPNSHSLHKSSIALREIFGRIIYRSW